MSDKGGVNRLSGNVLDMKFMKRTKIRIEEDARKEAERKKQEEFLKLNDPSTSAGGVKRQPIQFERRIEVLENLVFGRMSFKGFNNDIEKYMKYHERLRNGEEDEDDETEDIGDLEMAQQWGADAVLGRKFMTKRERRINESALIDETGSRSNKRPYEVQNGDKSGKRARLA
ncbi:hypothetical protein L596_024056 [Steinernema carpocapsae]|nr:hypothetical protein L596_024056 [Steinernema carpocapsae]